MKRHTLTIIALVLALVAVFSFSKACQERRAKEQQELRDYEACQKEPGCVWQ